MVSLLESEEKSYLYFLKTPTLPQLGQHPYFILLIVTDGVQLIKEYLIKE